MTDDHEPVDVQAWWCQRGDRYTIVDTFSADGARQVAWKRLRAEPEIVQPATDRQRAWWEWALTATPDSCLVATVQDDGEQQEMFG